MLKKHNPDWNMRSKLWNALKAQGLSLQQILKIVEPMRDKSEEEKEHTAEKLIEQVKLMSQENKNI